MNALKILLSLAAIATALSCGSVQTADTAQEGPAGCRLPRNLLFVTVAPTTCTSLATSCSRLRVLAHSNKLSDQVGVVSGVCNNPTVNPQPGCEIQGVYNWTATFCGDETLCGEDTFDVGMEFTAAINQPEIRVDDEITFCAYDEDNVIVECVSDVSKQCDSTDVIELQIP